MKRSVPYSSYNPFFFILFFIWVIAGGIALMLNDKESLFRLFNTNNRDFLDMVLPLFTLLGEGVSITVIMLALLFASGLRNWWYVFAALACVVLSALLTQLIKSIVDAERPLAYFNKANWIHILPGWHQHFHRSFPSGHTCGAFAMFCLLSCLLPKSYRWIGILFFIMALMVGYSRMYVAAHFFADVYAGSIVGVLFTTFVLSLLRRYRHRFLANEDAVS